ncbi:hypothetical protein R2F61_08535 [Mollicutes bacterium LVI A0078]|nr:hypothetical protein RZE84_08310 [Mollicutes bacterium LVI A0075]WOO90748.1 hypothetical protein R2F61_08535 [Mollicutes bacterium LVI A0078]
MGLPINKVLPTIEKIVDDLGYVLYDVESDKLGSNEVLRVLVQRADFDSVDLDDCVKITHGLTPTLDNDSNLANEYMLEVASPGVIRNLSKDFHFEQVIGQVIEVKTFKKLEGQESKKIIDKLVSVSEDEIELETVKINRSDVAKASTTFEF